MAMTVRMLWIVVIVCIACSVYGFALSRAVQRRSSLSMLSSPVRIGTRGSPLALAQAYETKRLLGVHFPELAEEGAVEICKIMTKGDSILNQALSEIGGKGLFTKELDTALLQNEVDICVHSMKDVPTWLPEGTVIPAMLEREDTNDVFISNKYKLSSLPADATIGSASLRRQAQLLSMYPRLQVVTFRGNVQTRLKKIDNGLVDGTLLALAGLKRLGMQELIDRSEIVPKDMMLPAVAQGAIGLHCLSSNQHMLRLLEKLNHPATKLAVDCERAFLAALDGNCRTPIAGQAHVVGDKMVLKGMLAKPDGTDILRVEVSGPCSTLEEVQALGHEGGRQIKEQAGSKFKDYQDATNAAGTSGAGWASK